MIDDADWPVLRFTPLQGSSHLVRHLSLGFSKFLQTLCLPRRPFSFFEQPSPTDFGLHLGEGIVVNATPELTNLCSWSFALCSLITISNLPKSRVPLLKMASPFQKEESVTKAATTGVDTTAANLESSTTENPMATAPAKASKEEIPADQAFTEGPSAGALVVNPIVAAQASTSSTYATQAHGRLSII